MAALGDLDGAVEDLGAGHEHHPRAHGHEPSRAGPAEVDSKRAYQAGDEGGGKGLGDCRRPLCQCAPREAACSRRGEGEGD